MIDPQQAGAQLHHGDVERGADGRQFITPFHRHFHAQIAVTQGFGQGGDAAGAAADRCLQAHEQVQRCQRQHAERHRHWDELLERAVAVVTQPRVQRGQRLFTQRAEGAEHAIHTAFEAGGIELDGAAEHAFVQGLQFVVQQLQAVVVLRDPGLQPRILLGLEGCGGLDQLVPCIANATA